MANVSLTREEAVRRAALVRVTGYDIELGLSEAESFRSRTVIGFTCAAPGAATFVELADAIDVRARLNGAALPAKAFEGNRIVLADLAADNELVVEARLPCVTTGDGMNRYVDPADGATYLTAFCGMDLAQRVFACFDQPDLRAPISLSVVAPSGWTVLANGRAELTDESEEHGWWRFATTPAISTYLFVVCAGPWHSVVWDRATPEGGIPFGWHARRSMARSLDSAADELRQITDACFDHYTAIFDEPFVFDSYDQVMAPGLNWGAMENPGCVTYRDELLFQGEASPADGQRRAMVIAHEMAHMWFGDLVSVRWWDDAWLSESFADYMGFEVSSSVAGFPGAWASFTIRQKLAGYEADERRSTHPVAPSPESVVDVDTAFGNFDHISYSKGNSVVRQLVTWLGEETFLRGANAYLTRHRLGNAELGDFLDAMDGVTERDVRAWSEVWLAATGYDTLRVRRDGDVPVLEREGSRPHRTLVGAYSSAGNGLVRHGERTLDIGADPVRLDDWSGLLVIPNSHDHTFARVRLDDKSWQSVVEHLSDIDDPQVRAVLWATALDMVHSGELAPADLIAMVSTHLTVEEHSSVWEGVFDHTLARVLPGGFPLASVAVARSALADTSAATLRAGRHGKGELALPATRGLAACTSDADLLAGWLVSGRTGDGIEVDTNLRWRILRRLAELDGVGPDRLQKEAAADPSTEAEKGAVRAAAALPSPDAKQRAWDLMSANDVSNRIFTATAEGFWVPEQGDLLAPYVGRYLDEAPGWAARRGQGFSVGVAAAFPLFAVDEKTVAGLEAALAGDVPTVLRRLWNDILDDLVMALKARSRWT